MTVEEGELSLVRRNGKSESAFRTISEVADDLDVPQHVLRFWEGKFPQVKPLKRGGGRRYYRPDDVTLLRRIRDLLYSEGYTIKGVQKLLKDGAVGTAPREVGAVSRDGGIDAEPELILDIHDPDPPEMFERFEEDTLFAAETENRTLPQPAQVDAIAISPAIRQQLESLLTELEALRGLLPSE